MHRPAPDATFLVVDQGGHASRAFVFDARGRALAQATREIRAQRPDALRAEYDGAELWTQLAAAVGEALARPPLRPPPPAWPPSAPTWPAGTAPAASRGGR
jgi:glycerol kinase